MSLDFMDLVLQASLVVQLVLVMLVVFSITSWAVILLKWRELRRAQQDSEAFLSVYREESLETAYRTARELETAPLPAVFLEGWGAWRRTAQLGGRPDPAATDRLVHQVEWAASEAVHRLERGLAFLATTGSATPFIGLFGTVVGIIDAFAGIGATGTASLAVVAPGIAEALIATAAGLVAAIPATIFYNQYVGRVRRLSASLAVFSEELARRLSRHAAVSESAARAAGR